VGVGWWVCLARRRQRPRRGGGRKSGGSSSICLFVGIPTSPTAPAEAPDGLFALHREVARSVFFFPGRDGFK
jgi:hypothetical protein